jgi:hypothetical protein
MLLTGNTGTAGVDFLGIYQNNSTVPNTPPSAPTGLLAQVAGTTVTLSWSAAADARTPAAALTYNLRVGTAPGGSEVVAPHSTTSGRRLLPVLGNSGHNLAARLNHLKPGTAYYWSVQSVDTAFAGSPFAAEGSFTALADPPGPGSIVQSGAAGVRLTWRGTPGAAYQVLASTNLLDWVVTATPSADTNGVFEVTDPLDGIPGRFYQAARP